MSRANMLHEAIRDELTIPDHIQVIANAVRADLLFGPAWIVRLEDIEQLTDDHWYCDYESARDAWPDATLEQVYTSDAADALRDWIGDLPTLYYCDESGFVVRDPDDAYESIDERIYPSEIARRDIIEALLGKTIAREFR